MKSFAVVFLVAAGSAVAASPDYFPLAPGNQWVFRMAGGRGPASTMSQTVDVLETRSVNGTSYQVVRGLAGLDVWVRSTPDGRVYAYDPETQVERLLYSFGSPEGQPYATGTACTPSGEVESRSVAFKGPAVQSEEALRIRYPEAFQCGYASETFVPGVGPVQRVQLRGPAQLTYELVYARVGGVTYGSAAVQAVSGDSGRSVVKGSGTTPKRPIRRE
jgi:hypothetical protein